MYSLYSKYLISAFQELDLEKFDASLRIIVDSLKDKRSVFIFGNGGSSATASHFVVDWTKGTSERLGFYPRVYNLTDNTPLLTALANDLSYDVVFSEQIKNLGQKGDIALAITGSGNSTNVVNGVIKASEIGMKTIALTGFDGGQVGKLVDINCNVNSDNIRLVEDIHASFGHSVVEAILREEKV